MSKPVTLLVGCVLFAALDPLFAQTVADSRYLDSKLPIEQRLDDLIPRMTTAEKIDQISDKWGSPSVPRLRIPSMLKTEGLHSQSYATGSTIFPEPIAMAASFDPELIEAVGRQTAVESKAAHILVSWSPVLDVARDIRWGRVEETYGESPYLVSQMGLGWIKGFQSEGLAAIPKHFAGHGEPQAGRDSMDLGLSERTMREIHLPSFRTAVEDGKVGGIMAAYSTWDGVPANASQPLLQGILRQEWGFDGMVISDCDAITHFITKHSIANTPEAAAALALKAGVNMECGSDYKKGIVAALDKGLITENELDAAVRPTLRLKMRLGLFEHPEQESMVWTKLPAYDTPASRALARRVEVEGAVLLKNDRNILPLNRQTKTIAVIGPDADNGQLGDYSPTPVEGQIRTVLQGIRDHVGNGTQILYAAGLSSPTSTDISKIAAAVDLARKAEVAIVVVGDLSNRSAKDQTTGENHDGATLELPGAQRQLVHAMVETGTPVVLVLVNGKPFTLAWEAEHVGAILVTWYPGEAGGNATADLLFGDKNPSGRLPVTWPRHAGQLPLNYDYHPSGRRYSYSDLPFSAQYRFGYGLSYTKFKYSNLRVSAAASNPDFVSATADVTNTGQHSGDEVAQLYVTDVVASVTTPVIELKGIKRVHLEPGETKEVSFTVTPYQLSLIDTEGERRVEPGVFRFHIGGVSPDLPDNVTDNRKQKIAFRDASEGVSGDFLEPHAYLAKFKYSMEAPTEVQSGMPFAVSVTIRNDGNLTDVAPVRLFAGVPLGAWRFEVEPGETKSHNFSVTMSQGDEIQLLTPDGITIRKIHVNVIAAIHFGQTDASRHRLSSN